MIKHGRLKPQTNLYFSCENVCRAAAAAAGLSMAEESSNSGRFRLERIDFSGGGMGNPAARQIYLTFPADSSFKEEDVSKYFRF